MPLEQAIAYALGKAPPGGPKARATMACAARYRGDYVGRTGKNRGRRGYSTNYSRR